MSETTRSPPPKAPVSYEDLKALHKETFDLLVEPYARRYEGLLQKELFLLSPLIVYLRKTFPDHPSSVLDVGCAVGGTCVLLSREGFRTSGIDLSDRMISRARTISPTSDFVVGDFLDFDFGDRRFNGICAKAIFHLFDTENAARFLRKAQSLLVRDGLLFLSVRGGSDDIGSVVPKRDYPGQPLRFRREWTLPELLKAVTDGGMEVLFWYEHNDYDRQKLWVDCWARRKA